MLVYVKITTLSNDTLFDASENFDKIIVCSGVGDRSEECLIGCWQLNADCCRQLFSSTAEMTNLRKDFHCSNPVARQ